MKLIVFLFSAFAAANAMQVDQGGPCCIEAFEHVNFQGQVRKYCGDASWEQFFSKDFNDIISSVRVPDCCSVRLYEHGYQGRELVLDKSEPNLVNRNFNDIVSSLKTSKCQRAAPAPPPPAPAPAQCCVEAFEHVNFQGQVRKYCGDASWEQFFSKDFNDIISSVRVPDCCYAKLYEHGYQGRDLDLKKDEPNLITRSFNDIVSSIKISRGTCGAGKTECCVEAFEHVNYEGQVRKYCGDASWENFFSKDFNDIISSVKVPNCCTVKLYEHGYQGRELVLDKDTPNLIPLNFNDIVSSMKVSGNACGGQRIIAPQPPAPAPAPVAPPPAPAPAAPPTTTCDVHEPTHVPNDLCAADGNAAKCQTYCKGKFGGELVAAKCSAPRENKQRECICSLKCCNQGCWGDPHCWTCDGVKFGYQGMKKHYMLKPVEDEFPTLPYFTITQINKVWQSGPMAILDISEVFVRDWKVTITVKTPDGPTGQFSLKVNDNPENIPWRFSKVHGHREIFANVAFGNDAKTQVVLTTSFGLRIVYTTQGAGNDRYTDLSIDTPRHPELKNHLHGLLGRWNDNPDDDSVDATGKKQPLDDGFSWAFGDSWIVPNTGRTPTAECTRDEAQKDHDAHVEKVDPKIKEAAEKTCKEALGRPEFTDCARKLNRAVPMIKNCVVDLIFLHTDEARQKYIKQVIASFEDTCKRREKQRQEEQHKKEEESVGLAFE